ncbi:hypothetical protein [Endozoicomonas sp.]|uniref:hypothetical protein n=1 Tax=Endozoicomonas sp. TaxID=1892382 RepID=UPI003AF90929
MQQLLGQDRVIIPVPHSCLRASRDQQGAGEILLEELAQNMSSFPVVLKRKPYDALLRFQPAESHEGEAGKARVHTSARQLLDAIVHAQKNGQPSSAHFLLRHFPLHGLKALINASQEGIQGAISQSAVMTLLADLTEILPEKAVRLLTELMPDQYFPFSKGEEAFKEQAPLAHSIAAYIKNHNAADRAGTTSSHQDVEKLRDLLVFWSCSRLASDGDITSLVDPEWQPQTMKVFCEELAAILKNNALTAVGLLGTLASAVTTAPMLGNQLNSADPFPHERVGDAMNQLEVADQERQKKQARESKGSLEQLISMATQSFHALLPQIVEKRTRTLAHSPHVVEHFINLAQYTGDVRFWQLLGAMNSSGHCSTQRLLMCHGGAPGVPDDDQLSHLVSILELNTLGDGNQAAVDYLAHTPKERIKSLANFITDRTEGCPYQTEELLKSLSQLPKGTERKKALTQASSSAIRDILRMYHLEQECLAVRQLLQKADQLKEKWGLYEQSLNNQLKVLKQQGENTPSQQEAELLIKKESAKQAFMKEYRAMLAVIPIERMTRQLIRGKAIQKNPGALDALKFRLDQQQIDALELVVLESFDALSEFEPEKVVPGALSAPLMDEMIARLKHKVGPSQYFKRKLSNHELLLDVFIKQRKITATVRQQLDSSNGSSEEYLKAMAAIFADYSELLLDLEVPLVHTLVLKGISAAYAAEYGRDLKDANVDWSDHVAFTMGEIKGRIEYALSEKTVKPEENKKLDQQSAALTQFNKTVQLLRYMIIFYHVTDKTKMPGSETVRTIINKKDEILSAVSSHFFSYLLANILASNGLSKIEADTVQDFAEQEREEITNILEQQLNQIIKQTPLGIEDPEETPPLQIVEQQLIPLLEGLEKIPVVGVMLAQKIRDGLSEMVNQLSTLFEVDITHQDSSEGCSLNLITDS